MVQRSWVRTFTSYEKEQSTKLSVTYNMWILKRDLHYSGHANICVLSVEHFLVTFSFISRDILAHSNSLQPLHELNLFPLSRARVDDLSCLNSNKRDYKSTDKLFSNHAPLAQHWYVFCFVFFHSSLMSSHRFVRLGESTGSMHGFAHKVLFIGYHTQVLSVSYLLVLSISSVFRSAYTSAIYWLTCSDYTKGLTYTLDKNIHTHHPGNPLGMYWKRIKPS